MTDFVSLGLAEPMLRALREEGYTTPTPIQLQAIPPVMAGSDLLGIAQTGTGKTAAFALPILHRLAADRRPAPRRGCRVLILSPTRELASQIGDSFRTYGRHMQLNVAVIFGGVAHRPQIQALARGIDILVATPGRLLDHVGERNAELSGVEILVLDEADQMLDLGFVKPIRRIVSLLTAKRQTLFFSATMPHEIAGLASEFLRDPVKIAVTPVGSTVDRVRQRVILVEAKRKRAMLTELFADPDLKRTLVFTRTKRGADKVANHLETGGINASAIHGNKSQKQREIALEAFRKGQVSVLVATDIAARGIDIDDVSHVVNFELPEVPEAYVHRIGRTARAGAKGSAISLCAPDERDLLRRIEQLTRRKIDAEDRMRDAYLETDTDPMPSRADRGHRGGRRTDDAGRRPQGGRPGSGERRPERSNGEARSDARPAGFNRDRDRGGDRANDQRGSDRPHRAERPNGEARSDARPAGFNRDRDRGSDRPTAHRGSDRPHRPEHANGEARSDARPAGFNRDRDRGGDRPNPHRGSDRPHRAERPNGEARSDARPAGFNRDRDRGGDRPNPHRGSDRPQRAERPNGEARSDARPAGFNRDRDRGGDRPNPHRGSDRPQRPERNERSDRGDRPQRSDRPQAAQRSESGSRDNRSAAPSTRPTGADRPRRFSRPREGGREQQG